MTTDVVHRLLDVGDQAIELALVSRELARSTREIMHEGIAKTER